MSKMGNFILGVQEVVDNNFDSDFSVVEEHIRAAFPQEGDLAVNIARDEHDVILREWIAYTELEYTGE